MKDSSLPAYPPIEAAFKRAEADSNLKSSSKFKHEDVEFLTVEVRNLNYKQVKCPAPEKDVLNFNSSTRTSNKDTPKHPHEWGQKIDKAATDVWHAGMRAAGLLSSAGMLVAYMHKLCSVSNVTAHHTALEAAGVDTAEFGDLVGTDAGLDFVMEMERIANSLAGLVYSTALESGTCAAGATLVRRRLWMEAAGVKDEYSSRWMAHSTASNQGLFGLTTDMVAAYKTAQEARETLHKELKPMMKAPPAGSQAGRGGASKAAIDRAEWRKQYPQKAFNKKRGNFKNKNAQRPPSQSEPAVKSAKTTPESTDKGKPPGKN